MKYGVIKILNFFFFLEKSEFVDYGNKVCEKTSFYQVTTFFKGISEKLCQMFLGVYFCRQYINQTEFFASCRYIRKIFFYPMACFVVYLYKSF